MSRNPDQLSIKPTAPQETLQTGVKPEVLEAKVERPGSPEARSEQLKSLNADMEETEAQMSACGAELEMLRGMVSSNPDGVSQQTRVQFEAMKTAMKNLQKDYMDTQIQIDKLEDDEAGKASQSVATKIEVAKAVSTPEAAARAPETAVQTSEAVIQPAKTSNHW